MDTQALNDQGRDQWDKKAAFWDRLHGDRGNSFHQVVIGPPVEHLLELRRGEHILDIACGSGVLARRLAELGGVVTAVDFSAELIRLAGERGQPSGHPIDYRIIDATDENALRDLGTFDAITCTMALMDMPVIAPLFRAVRAMLNPEGRFVLATMHPAFNSTNPVFVMQTSDDNGELSTRIGVTIFGYLDIPPVHGVGAPDEPNPHTYYHRSLGDLLGPAFAAGLVLDGIEEPAFPEPESGVVGDRLSWHHIPQIPPVFAARLR